MSFFGQIEGKVKGTCQLFTILIVNRDLIGNNDLKLNGNR